MKLRILEQGFTNYTGPLGDVFFKDGVSVEDVTGREAARLTGVMAMVDAGTGEQVSPGNDFQHNFLNLEAENVPINYATEEQFEQLRANASEEIKSLMPTPDEMYGVVTSAREEDKVIVDDELSKASSDGSNGFNGQDSEAESDTSDLMQAQADATATASDAQEGASAGAAAPAEAPIEQVAETAQETTEAPADARIYTREELEGVADSYGITGLRTIADPLNVKSKSITALIDGILEAQVGK